MNRSRFAVGLCCVLAAPAGRAVAQDSIDTVTQLIAARDQAANHLIQVHQLAKYTQADGSAPPIDVAGIDRQYDEMVSAVNGYLSALSAAIDDNLPLDDAKLKSEGDAAIALARKFDDSLQTLRDRSGPTTAVRGPAQDRATSALLAQVFVPNSALRVSLNKAVDGADADKRKRTAKALLAARWQSSADVLSPPAKSAEKSR